MTGRTAGAVLAALARVALGALWINEGLLKYRAHFGSADILLVVSSTQQNPRVPGFYKGFTAAALGEAPGLFGVGVPAIETLLGVVLVLGILPLPAALVSMGELANYWFADQLIVQYPVMAVLSIVVGVTAAPGARFGLPALLRWRRRHRERTPRRAVSA